MDFNELPIKKRYDKLLDDLALSVIISYTHAKEQGTTDALNNLYVAATKKMLPGYLGVSAKLLKKIAPNKTFKKMVKIFVNSYLQAFHSLSNVKVIWVSDTEAKININCEFIDKMKKVVDKTGFNVDHRIWCKSEAYIYKELMKQFGLDVTLTPEANGCQTIAKLK